MSYNYNEILKMAYHIKLVLIVFFNFCFSQNIIDSYLIYENNTILLKGDSLDGLYKPRDLDIPNDSSRSNELWVINENSAFFDSNNGGSTVTYYNFGTDSQWADYRKDAYSAHFMHTASAIAFSDNGGFANTLDVQDANNNPNGYFSGCTLWDSDTSIYARINQNGPLLGSHWDMIHQSPYSVGIAGQTDNIYWLFDGYHQTIAKYDFNEPHSDHEHGGEDHSDGIVYRYDEIEVQRVPGLSSHMEIDRETGWLYICDTGNQRVLRLNTSSGEIGESLTTYGESLAGYFSMVNAEYEVVIDDLLIQPTGLDINRGRLLVSDYYNGVINIYNIQNNNVNRLGEIQTGFENEIMGIKVDSAGSIWIVCKNSHELYQLSTIFMGDVNNDLHVNITDFLLISLYIIGNYEIIGENYTSADMNFDDIINIIDLLILSDLMSNEQ